MLITIQPFTYYHGRSIWMMLADARISSWNYHFDAIIMVYDLIQNENDSCVNKKVSGSALTVAVL